MTSGPYDQPHRTGRSRFNVSTIAWTSSAHSFESAYPSRGFCERPWPRRSRATRRKLSVRSRSEEHTSELQSHRDLHSFPTRRSSDLHPPTVSSRRTRHGAFAKGRGHAGPGPRGENYRSDRDRKSTRLNSSPTEISTLSLHDALPIFIRPQFRVGVPVTGLLRKAVATQVQGHEAKTIGQI